MVLKSATMQLQADIKIQKLNKTLVPVRYSTSSFLFVLPALDISFTGRRFSPSVTHLLEMLTPTSLTSVYLYAGMQAEEGDRCIHSP